MDSPTTTEQPRDEVAAYKTAAGATEAATHLVEMGFDEESVLIAPRSFVRKRQHPLAIKVYAGVRIGAALGAVAAGSIWLLDRAGVEAVVNRLLPAMLVGTAIGLALGALLASMAAWQEHRRGFGPPPEQLLPVRYEVVVQNEARRANHELARWWDPDHPTVPLRRSA